MNRRQKNKKLTLTNNVEVVGAASARSHLGHGDGGPAGNPGPRSRREEEEGKSKGDILR